MGQHTSKSGGGSARSAGYTDEADFKAFQQANFEAMKALHKQGGMQAVREAWYETRAESERRGAHELTEEQAVDLVLEAVPRNISEGWFRNANSDYKPKLVQSIMQAPGAINAGWNIAYRNYVDSLPDGQTPQSFERWLRTPQTLYRGTNGQRTVGADVFSAYTPDRRIAEKFGDQITTIRIRPIDTWGSYQTTGEQEFLVPAKRLR